MGSVIAAIDCGTNSTRLLIGRRTHNQGFKTIVRETIITQLGEGVEKETEDFAAEVAAQIKN